MARPGEIVGVLKDGVCMPRRHTGVAYRTPAVVFAPSDELLPMSLDARPVLTKTGEQDDTVPVDSASFVGIDFVLRAALDQARRQAHPRLFFLLTYPVYAKHVAVAGRALRLPFPVSPYVFRHGGASEAVHRQVRTLKEVQVRGRWRAFSSVRRYQKAGRLLHMIQRLSSTLMNEGLAAEKAFPAFLK